MLLSFLFAQGNPEVQVSLLTAPYGCILIIATRGQKRTDICGQPDGSLI